MQQSRVSPTHHVCIRSKGAAGCLYAIYHDLQYLSKRPKFGGRFCSGPSKECRTCNCQVSAIMVVALVTLCVHVHMCWLQILVIHLTL